MISLIKTIIKNRRQYLKKMYENNMSVYDMAKFFQISPRVIRISLNKENIKDFSKPGFGYDKMEEIEHVFKYNVFEEQKDKVSPYNYGFIHIPEESEYKTIADDWLKKHKDDDVLLAVFIGKKPADVAKAMGTTNCLLKRVYQRKNINLEEIYDLGKDYRNKQSMYKIWELHRYGFTPNEIKEYLKITDNEYLKAKRYAQNNNIDIEPKSKKYKTEYIKNLLLDGNNSYSILEALGVDDRITASILQSISNTNNEKRFSYKEEKRRELIFTLYTKDLLTQQEIANKLNISRGTVITDLKTYRKDHPEEVDKTYLWRQRNLASPTKALRINRKGLVLSLYKNGSSVKDIQRIVQVREETIKNYLSEEGKLEKNIGQQTLEKNRHNIWKCTQKGYTKEQIADKLNLNINMVERTIKRNEKYGEPISRRAEELKLAWQNIPTSEICQIVGRNRLTVLKDQHKTADILRNNEFALDFVKSHNGDITEELFNKEII